MALPPQKFREMVFQILYGLECKSSDIEEKDDFIAMMMCELEVTRKSAREAYEFVELILVHLSEIDQKIQEASIDYQFDRISSVEKNILRLGSYELFYRQDPHPNIVIAEAIRLCRKFGTPESSLFVNAVLDAVYKKKASLLCPLNTDCKSEES